MESNVETVEEVQDNPVDDVEELFNESSNDAEGNIIVHKRHGVILLSSYIDIDF